MQARRASIALVIGFVAVVALAASLAFAWGTRHASPEQVAARSHDQHVKEANRLIDTCQEVGGELYNYQRAGADPMSYACIAVDDGARKPLHKVCTEIDGRYEQMRGANWSASCEQQTFQFPYEELDY